MFKYLIVLLFLVSFSANAASENDNIRVKNGFLIIDVSTTRSDVLNLILKLNQIESVVRSKVSGSDGVEYHIVINMDTQNEHIHGNNSYKIRFTNLVRSTMIYKDIMVALTS